MKTTYDVIEIARRVTAELNTLIEYRADRFARGDDHGVRDACTDIECRKAELAILQEVLRP